ncbi:MAG: AtpZ/AtpI family protein [Firmicutes bacterium]|nr:AtpZ/AtpI family protein [Bacillota bacterium]
MSRNGSQDPRWLAVARNLSLLGQLGIQIAAPIIAGVIAGSYMARRTDNLLWQLGGVLLGLFAGLWSGFRLLWGVLRDVDHRP